MRILLWMETHHPVIGGIQTAVRQYLPALRQRGYEVAVVASHYTVKLPDVIVQDTVAIHRFHFHEALEQNDAALFIQERNRVSKFMDEFAPDLVHFVGFGPSGIFFLKLRSRGPHSHAAPPYILTIRNEDSRKVPSGDGTLLHQLMAGASWVTTASQLEAGRFAALRPEIANRISCVYHGLAMPTEPLMAPPLVPRLLCIGRLVRQKNFALALYAFAQISRAFADVRLLFAGDGEELPMLEALAAELGITAQVDFLGWVQPEDIPALINQANAVILPSRWEGLPLTAIQVAQMARPMIATRVSGTPEVVIDGETGFLVPSDDAEALATAMHTILSDPARAVQLGQAAQKRIYTKFSLSNMVDAYTTLYERLASPAPM